MADDDDAAVGVYAVVPAPSADKYLLLLLLPPGLELDAPGR